jgi:hypothetical protein
MAIYESPRKGLREHLPTPQVRVAQITRKRTENFGRETEFNAGKHFSMDGFDENYS